MCSDAETIALVALLRTGRRPWSFYAPALQEIGSARVLLDEEQGLLAEAVMAQAAEELREWEGRHIEVVSVLDRRYPRQLMDMSDRPPILFIAGGLVDADEHAVAVIGTRQPTARGRHIARSISHRLVDAGIPVASGLAAGIDTAAHQGALERGGRTIAVIGSGLDHAYPRENTSLQRQLAREGAVISQFWPESRPSRRSFPLRNALMAGLTPASVIVEASAMSGTRILARAAVGLRRVVVLLDALLDQPWAQELAAQPGVEVVESAAEVTAVIERARIQPALL
jgi:DNA processing protein